MKSMVKGLLLACLVILSLELLARTIKTIIDDTRQRESADAVLLEMHRVDETGAKTAFALSSDLGWTFRPDFRGMIFGKPCILDREGYLRTDGIQIRSKKNPLIVVVGDSWVFGNLVPVEETFVELLDEMLPDFSVVNLGVPGYSSYQGYELIRQRILELNPALVIVAFNFNDRKFVYQREAADSQDRFLKMYQQQTGRSLLNHSYFLRFIQFTKKLFNEKLASRRKIDLRTLHARVPPEAYRENLEKMAALSSEKNIPFIFLLFKQNPEMTRLMLEGLRLYEKGQDDRAIERLKAFIESRNYFSTLARKNLAKIYEKKGMLKEAEDIAKIHRRHISALGGWVIYSTQKYNRIMAEVARENQIEIVDPRRFLTRQSFLDLGHLSGRGHRQIARHLYDVIGNSLSRE